MKQKAYPGSLYDLRRVEKWLEDLSAHGLQLEAFSNLGKLAKLQEVPSARRRYYLEPDFDQYGGDEAEKVYTEQGWNYVCTVNGIFLVYETEDPWAQKPQRWNVEEKKLRKKWRNLWLDLILWLVSLGLAGGKVILDALEIQGIGLTYYDRLTGIWLLLIPAILLLLMEFWLGFTKGYDLYIWRKSIWWQEETAPWYGMKVVRWIEYCILPIGLAAVILVLLTANGIGSRTYVPIWRQDRVLPMVTLDVTEDEVHYAPEPYGPGIDVSFRHRLLIPQDICINSYGMHENPGELDAWRRMNHISNSDAEMRFSYYRLWTEEMAMKLADDEAGSRETKRVEHESFDELWLWSKQREADEPVWQKLIAREGDVVITISYRGESHLERHLDEIFEIITEYRGQ